MSDFRDDPKWSARAKLFDDLRHGRLARHEDAERIAAEQGLEALYQPPDPALYDPHRLSRWTISMTVAWIAWRDLERVRAADNEFRRESCVWVFQRWRGPVNGEFVTYNGWELQPWKDATIAYLFTAASHPDAKPRFHGVYEAQELLWSTAGEEKITGEAIRATDGFVVEIPSREWRFLRPSEERDKEVLVLEHKRGVVAYSDVAFPRATILSLWPANGVTIAEVPPNQHEALKATILQLWPEGIPPRSKLRAKERDDEIVREMKAKGYRLPDDSKSRATVIQRAIRNRVKATSDKRDKRDKRDM